MVDEVQTLKRDIAVNNAVIVIGTDVSTYTIDGDGDAFKWKDMLEHGLEQCHQRQWMSAEDVEKFKLMLDSNNAEVDDYFHVANRIKCCDTCRTWLAETTGRLSVKNPELIRIIAELGCPIVTTNYDTLLEDVLHRKPLTWNECDAEAIFDSNETIMHLYGCCHQPSSLIFDRDEYDRIHQDETVKSKLRKLIEGKTIVFIGYGSTLIDPHWSSVFSWITSLIASNQQPCPMYKLVKSNRPQVFDQSTAAFCFDVPYGNTFDDLITFIRSLQSFRPLIRTGVSLSNGHESIRRKYLNYLLDEYGRVSIFGSSSTNISLPLDSVYVELKFDPTHPSIKAMKTMEISEEFKRTLLSRGFFTSTETTQLNQAIVETSAFNSETIYKNFMIDQWLSVLLSNERIFTKAQAASIKSKVSRLKASIVNRSHFQETQQYTIGQAYQQFRHLIILGHPGSGKTTLSKWLVINLAKQCLGESNTLFAQHDSSPEKIPILIPIWKYVDQLRANPSAQNKSLLQFIYENPTCNSTWFDAQERRELSSWIRASLAQGQVLVIFEGLDEVPAYVDRSHLIREINLLLEHGIDYDARSGQLLHSIHEQKQINNTKDPTSGNRFLVTSRIEGNYYEDLNFYIPRLTIEDMSNEALRLLCSSYTDSIARSSAQPREYTPDQLYHAIARNKDIFQLAINPQLASVIAAIYHQHEDQLPKRRIDMYETVMKQIVQRLIGPQATLSVDQALGLTSTMLWSIMEEIADYLHSKVEGLSEDRLKHIIRTYLTEHRKINSTHIDDLIAQLVDIFKYQAGLLNEFGHDSFRFIHRTFQEYFAARHLLYVNGQQRSEDAIYENVRNKIGVPNWRVPLSMMFGMLSQSTHRSPLFQAITKRLFADQQTSSLGSLVPFVLTDSLNDISFPSEAAECALIENLADLLLADYQNVVGFARLDQHQRLIHYYFSKLKDKYEKTLTQWFIGKLSGEVSVASCAQIIYQLKWFHPRFHELCLLKLHYDSPIWHWPIDNLLRFYSSGIRDEAVLNPLVFRAALHTQPHLVQYIRKDRDWLAVVTSLYGGYANDHIRQAITKYHELGQFLDLNEKQRAPFMLYFQDLWGEDDPAYNMAVYLDTKVDKHLWRSQPVFDSNAIYKESFLTEQLIELLLKEKFPRRLVEDLRKRIDLPTLSTNERSDMLMVLSAMGDFDFLERVLKDEGELSLAIFGSRIEQLINTLKDPIAKCSESMTKYLLAIHAHRGANSVQAKLGFSDLCRIHLSFIARSGGLPVDTYPLAEVLVDDDDDMYAEYFAYQLTGAKDCEQLTRHMADQLLRQVREAAEGSTNNKIISETQRRRANLPTHPFVPVADRSISARLKQKGRSPHWLCQLFGKSQLEHDISYRSCVGCLLR